MATKQKWSTSYNIELWTNLLSEVFHVCNIQNPTLYNITETNITFERLSLAWHSYCLHVALWHRNYRCGEMGHGTRKQPCRSKLFRKTRLKILDIVQISIISNYSLFKLSKYWLCGKKKIVFTHLHIQYKYLYIPYQQTARWSNACWHTALHKKKKVFVI
jgi:hypothetical protein